MGIDSWSIGRFIRALKIDITVITTTTTTTIKVSSFHYLIESTPYSQTG